MIDSGWQKGFNKINKFKLLKEMPKDYHGRKVVTMRKTIETRFWQHEQTANEDCSNERDNYIDDNPQKS